MKILKPGKVEMRKFTCSQCECVFAATEKETDRQERLQCPTCASIVYWSNGRTYKPPVKTVEDELEPLVWKWRLDKQNPNVPDLVELLIANGVTFKEEQ